ncbi:hypothetical protein IM774_05195, partial [Erysipelotrichaceae bacterium RD49]|nr:hypothetical protein [Erysipelotrichaceae bacterium RD49]
PSFAGLSDLRNKKANLLHYIRHHNLPDQVKKQLLAKVDRLETLNNISSMERSSS